MGVSKSKTKSTVAPSSVYKPQIDASAATLAPSYDAATANNAALLPKVNQALDTSSAYYNKVLGGDFLQGNPYLQHVIDSTNQDVTQGVNSQFERAGRYGSGAYAGVLAKQLAANENNLRYGDYATERANQGAAAQALPGVTNQSASVSSGLPQAAANSYADAIRALLGGYTTQTGTQSQGIGGILGQVAGAGLAGWASGGFKGV